MALLSDHVVGIADRMLARAYELAEHGRGTTSPNPLVGCVVVRDGAIVGEGWHERAGGPHAEVRALDAAGTAARGADVFVTLEPCNHVGRTPPCADRLVAAGVRSVTIGMRDPNPEVTGNGAAALERAGIRVAWADDPGPFEMQNEAWLIRLRDGRPFVRVKVALTLDGHSALVAGHRARITGDGARALTMRLRTASPAIMVGATTLAVDDPSLTARDDADLVRACSPRRYVLSRTTVPCADATMFADGCGPATLITADTTPDGACAELKATGVRVARYPASDGIAGALRALAEDGVNEVLVEAGPALLTALWDVGMIDELVVMTAGGMAGPGAPAVFLGHPDVGEGDLRPTMEVVEAGVAGHDAVTVWRPRR